MKDVRELILGAREGVARTVDSALTTLYWQIGRRVRQDILKEKRADYGKQIVSALGRHLAVEFGRGFDEKSLRLMIRFAEAFADENIVSALRRQLTWTHFKRLIYLDDPLKRDFYAEMCRIERWSTRTLEKKIGGMLFERTALSKKPAQLAALELKQLREEDKLTPDLVFRDPYLLGFLGLKDSYLEKDLEEAILRDMESFILELGVGFAFLERQKRITLDGVAIPARNLKRSSPAVVRLPTASVAEEPGRQGRLRGWTRCSADDMWSLCWMATLRLTELQQAA